MKYFSMFTGIGGFELGIEDKAECVGFSEIDKYACELLKKKFPNTKNYGNAKKIKPEELPDFDMLCGGFPCQSFSIAGKRKGFDDTRGTMFFEIARILEVKRPKLILLENVKGLLNHDKGKTFSVIIQTLEELGYRTQWMVLNSKFFGVPQNRERVFIIGSLRETSRPEVLPFKKGNKKISRIYKKEKINKIKEIIRIEGETPSGYSRQKDRLYHISGISPCIQTVCFATPKINSSPIRFLTPLECERLQGFPDNWTSEFNDPKRYKLLGNAVTVNVISNIIKKIIEIEKKKEKEAIRNS